MLQLGKEEREKQKSHEDQGKGIDRDFILSNQDTIEGVIGFKIDSRTINRGDLTINTVI